MSDTSAVQIICAGCGLHISSPGSFTTIAGLGSYHHACAPVNSIGQLTRLTARVAELEAENERLIERAPLRLVCSAGSVDVVVGTRFSADGVVWEIIRRPTEAVYSPSGLGGTPVVRCKLISGEPDGRFTPLENGECDWCGDSIAHNIIAPAYAFERIHRQMARAEAAERERDELRRENERLTEERDEAVNWNDLVDRHGIDQFDDLADAWLAMEPIKRVHNAVASVFSKWANDELMTRFKQHMSNSLQMAFVEGCLCGVRAAEAKARALAAQEGGNAEHKPKDGADHG